MLIKDGNLRYDPEWSQNNWPNLNFNSWIQIDPLPDFNNFKKARLIINSDFENKTFNIVENTYSNEEIVSTLMWCEFENFYEVTGISIAGEGGHPKLPFRVLDFGNSRSVTNFMANAVRNWLTLTYKIKIVAPPPINRSLQVEKLIKEIEIEFEDDSSPFLEESDGQYYYYSEWVKKFIV